MSAKHTPTPWGIEHTPDRIWLGPMRPDGVKVAEVINFWDTSASYRKDVVERREADVAFIVLACNSFDALTEANARQRELLEQINVAACYASEEDPASAKEALLHIGELARDALKGAA